jgi:hypothetical protein
MRVRIKDDVHKCFAAHEFRGQVLELTDNGRGDGSLLLPTIYRSVVDRENYDEVFRVRIKDKLHPQMKWEKGSLGQEFDTIKGSEHFGGSLSVFGKEGAPNLFLNEEGICWDYVKGDKDMKGDKVLFGTTKTVQMVGTPEEAVALVKLGENLGYDNFRNQTSMPTYEKSDFMGSIALLYENGRFIQGAPAPLKKTMLQFIQEMLDPSPVKLEEITVHLNGSYSAEVTKGRVKVGCQTIPIEKIRELVKAYEEVNA